MHPLRAARILSVRDVLHKQFMCSSSCLDLKKVLSEKIPPFREEVMKFRKEHNNTKFGGVTVGQVYGGMRGIGGLICETSLLDPEEGIRFRGFTIQELQEKLPKLTDDGQPLPEGLFWLLCTGDIPTEDQAKGLSIEWGHRATLPKHVTKLLKKMPPTAHPMVQFSAAIIALSTESQFTRAYMNGVKKQDYWEYVYEDVMNLLAKLVPIAAMIYINLFRNREPACPLNPEYDWSANLCYMMGYDDEDFLELIRLYLTIHSDHEGGNVSAHTVHLVGSALSDPYLAFGAGMCGLAGPLHGLANQEVLVFVNKMMEDLGEGPSDDQVKQYCEDMLKAGRVIPGYGHAVLRKTDPRYTCQADFANKYLPDDEPMLQIVKQLFKLVPPILERTGKVKNPWPNVDAHSGVLLQYYGMKEMCYYTVLFGVSRALGTLAQLIWSRALGFPIERPKSITTHALKKLVERKDNDKERENKGNNNVRKADKEGKCGIEKE